MRVLGAGLLGTVGAMVTGCVDWDWKTTDTGDTIPTTDPDGTDTEEVCDPAVGEPGQVDPLEQCLGYDADLVVDAWDVALEWADSSVGSIVSSPVTGHLTDDNGDGEIDAADIPDVAFVSYSDGRLYILSGDGGGVHCSQAGWRADGGVIVADVNGDGRNEVAGALADGRIRAVDGRCQTVWTSTTSYSLLYPVGTAADLDGDGHVEVIVDVAVVDGRTGNHIATLAPTNNSCWRAPFTGDIDQDGQVEIILADSVFSSDGTRRFSLPIASNSTSCFGGLVNLDDDPEAEIVIASGYEIGAFEHDGTPIWRESLSAPNPGPLCAGDIDGDGAVEIVAPNGTWITAFEANGRVKWSSPMQDLSGAAGCVVFDMNGDGAYEVLFADEIALRVHDGATGTVLWENATHDSVTYFETPTVADVDNDGSAEMLVVNSPYGGGATGLTVFGHNGSGWPTSGPTWGLHDYSATNQNADGSIPTDPVAPWLEYNVFRGRPYDDVPGAPNLRAELVDLCASCDPEDGGVSIAFQVTNDGGVDAAPTSAAVYLVDADGSERFYGAVPVAGAGPGEVLSGTVFDIALADWTGAFVIRLDDDGAGGVLDECIEDDNEIRGEADFCE